MNNPAKSGNETPLTGPGSWRWEFRREATECLQVFRGYGNEIYFPEVVHAFEMLVTKYSEKAQKGG